MNKKTKLIRNALYFFPQGIPLFRYAKFTLTLLIFQFSFTNANAQTCNTNIVVTTPTIDFTVHNNGTVTHETTGLMWKVCSEGQTWNSSDGCTGSAASYTWQEALEIPQSLNAGEGFANQTDWRLPNLKELKSIAELSCYSPAINETIFNSTPSAGYWSSSPIADYSNYAWGVYFGYGFDDGYDRYGSGRVRLVRSGQ